MTDLRVGRLLPACLHQAIAEELADRLDFYENWLGSGSLRDGAVSLAALRAVLGFLRTEPEGVFDLVTTRAGTLAAEWSRDQTPAFRRRLIGWMPQSLRFRAAMRVACSTVGRTGASTRATSRIRGSRAELRVTPSMFCDVRQRQAAPMCRFYVALIVATLAQFELTAAGAVEECRAVEAGQACRMSIELGVAADAARAA